MKAVKPGVSLCMIVKDEELNLSRCLNSVAGLLDEIVVVDTGSTDRTIQIAREYGASVYQIPWPGSFSVARNFALEKAGREWIFCLDADEELAAQSRAALRSVLNSEGVEGYLVSVLNLVDSSSGERDILRHVSLRLCRNRPEYQFQGVLHEEILSSIYKAYPRARVELSTISVIHHGYTANAKAAKKKGYRNLEILRNALIKTPDDLLLRYNLALEYWQLGQFSLAAQCFEQVYARCDWRWPHAAALVRNYGICLLELEEFAKAVEVLLRGTTWFPIYTDLFYLLALAYRGLQQPEKAIQAANRCLELGEPPAGYVSTLGVGGHKACQVAGEVLEQLQEYEEAAKAYTVALQRHPQYLPALYGLLRVLNQLYDAPGCISYLERYFDFESVSASEVVIRAMLAVGMHEAAILAARQAVKSKPQNQTLQFLLARSYLLKELEVLATARRRFHGVPALEKEWQAAQLAIERLDRIS